MTFQNLLIKNCSKFQGKYIMKRIRYGVDDVEEPHLVKVLEERVKELNCLYGISKSLSSYDKSLDDILNEVVNLIPPAFQYPELTCVRILLNGQEFKTNQFQKTLWKISSELSTPDEKIGVLEVYYLKKVPEEFESPFLKEEQDLINAISIELIRFLRRKKAETLLKESEDNLRLILTSAAEAIYGLDVDGNCTFCNPACIRLLGYEEPEELLGTNIHNLVHTSQEQISPDIESCPVKKSYKTGKHVHVDDVVFWRKDGSTFNAECWSYPTIKDGEIVGAVVTFIDITQRLDIEKDRDRLFNFSIDMMCIAGFDGYFKKLNPAWEKTLGWTTTELTSKPYQEFMHPDDRKRTVRLIKSLKKGDNILKFDNRYLCNDGSYKWLSWNAYILAEEELVFGVARDATELKENEEALKESEKKYRGSVP